jgi:hypothetical protein
MNELDKLREMLTSANIPFESYQEKHPALLSDNDFWKDNFMLCAKRYGECGIYGRNQIIYGRSDENSWKLDGICQYGSYGANEGMIETYGELGTGEDGEPRVLDADQVFEIIKEDFGK